MILSMEMILSAVVGFLMGCIISALIAIYFYYSQQRNLEKSSQLRHQIVSSIGRLCSSIENAFSSYRVGVMSYDNLKDVLLEKIDQINTSLNSNIDILDSFYIKNIERFIVDQKCFLLHDEKERPATTTGESRRGISRAILQDIDQLGKTEETELPSLKPPRAKIPKGGITFEKDSQKPVDAAIVEKPADGDVFMPMKEPKKEKEPKIKLKEVKEQEAVKVDKKKPPEPVIQQPPVPEPAIPEPPIQEERDARAEVLSAFEDGVTTRIPIDAIKQYTEKEELFELKEEPVLDTVTEFEEAEKKEEPSPFVIEALDEKKPIEEESPLRSSADVDATQIYNIQDLLGKAQKKQDKKIGKEKEIETPKPSPVASELEGKEGGSYFDVNIPRMPLPGKSGKEGKKDSRDEDLITGDDVLDQMDNFFGFSKK